MARKSFQNPATRRRVAFAVVTRLLKRWAQLEIVRLEAGRPGLSRLAMPAEQYRVDLHGQRRGEPFFDRVNGKRAEDLYRASGLQKAEQLTEADQQAARTLARLLADGATDGPVPQTLASALHMRDVRIRVTGAVVQLHRTLRHTQRSVFTLIPRGMSLTPEQLREFDPRRAKRALRSALNRAGAAQADGALAVFLHGEWDETTGRFQMHWHGWAAGGMVDVVRRLRRQAAYLSTKAARGRDTDGVRNRVVVSRKQITNAFYRVSYLTQSFYPSRPTGVLAETAEGKGGRFRVRGKQRIPEPTHSQQLLWLSRWRLEDISLLMKVSVVRGHLRLNNAQVSYTNRGR